MLLSAHIMHGTPWRWHHRRTRIDYIFAADATIAEAHADHPGWAGEEPGSHSPENFKYSDHRWVWARVAVVPSL